MDLLFREYASPFSLLDVVIPAGRFTEWLDHFLAAHKEKVQWEYWLHREFEKTWADYLNECEAAEKTTADLNRMASWNRSDIETTIKTSYFMMQNFNPDERGEG